MIMIIGFIGFGKVSKNLIKLIKSDEIKFITSFENRLAKSTTDYNIEVLDSYKEVCEKSDILISANSPENALNVAIEPQLAVFVHAESLLFEHLVCPLHDGTEHAVDGVQDQDRKSTRLNSSH